MFNPKTLKNVTIGVAVGSLILRAFALVAKTTPSTKDDKASATANAIFETLTGVRVSENNA
jgi:hypothetical protein